MRTRRPRRSTTKTTRTTLPVGLLIGCMGLGMLVGAIGSRPAGAVGVRNSIDSIEWTQQATFGGRGAPPMVVAETSEGSLALGDAAGVSWHRAGEWERAALPGVLDLAFDARGVLWIGTARGLFHWAPSGRPVARSLLRGGGGVWIRQIVGLDGSLLLASSAGAYWSSDGRLLQPLVAEGLSTARPVDRVAMRFLPGDRGGVWAELWILGGGRLLRVRGIAASSGLRVLESTPLPLPRLQRIEQPAVDLVIDPSGDWLYLVLADQLARLRLPQTKSSESQGDWQVLRPVMPPGAKIQRVAWADGRVWIATDHGLLASDDSEGAFIRTTSPVGTTACSDVAPSRRFSLLVVCRTGLFAKSASALPAVAKVPLGESLQSRSVALTASGSVEPLDPMPPDPPLAAIRGRALDRAGLAASRSQQLWEGLRRRGYLPEVDLSFGVDVDRDERRDRDQTFVSGATRHLSDHSRDETTGFAAAIRFDWDLRDLFYPSDSVDLSREQRQVVSLRDDVADEINQLYYERQRIRDQLRNDPPAAAAEINRLRWRARELDAGLDAWTGGWIARWRALRSSEADAASISILHPDQRQKKVTRKLE